jgi:hypothetical protein
MHGDVLSPHGIMASSESCRLGVEEGDQRATSAALNKGVYTFGHS